MLLKQIGMVRGIYWWKKIATLPSKKSQKRKGYLKITDLIEYLRSLNLCYLLHTEANVRGCKIYGNPIMSRQDWIEVEVDSDFFQMICLIFFKLDHML